MKNSTPVRKYHSQVRAEAEALTHQRIISAALSLYAEKWLDQIAIQQRQDPPVGDIPRAIAGLMDHYEDMAPTGLRTLALEGRYPELDALLVEGRQKHQEWVERVFSPYLNRAPKKDRQRLKVELASLCDTYMWKLLRMDGGLSPEQAELSFNEMLTALLAQKHLLE